MQIRTPRDVGREAASCRRFLRLKQSDLARACGTSRQWISALEHGKASLELGLVLRAFEELGLDLAAKRADDPPPWTVVLTADAEMREMRSLTPAAAAAFGSASASATSGRGTSWRIRRR